MKSEWDYSKTDSSDEFKMLVEQLDVVFDYPDIVSYKKIISEWLNLQPADHVLDVG